MSFKICCLEEFLLYLIHGTLLLLSYNKELNTEWFTIGGLNTDKTQILIENYDIYRMSNNKDLELEVKMPNFLVSELNLPLVNGCMYYKNEK